MLVRSLQLLRRFTELTSAALGKRHEVRPLFRGGSVETDFNPLRQADAERVPVVQLLRNVLAVCPSQRHLPCWGLSPPPPAVVAGAPVVSASPQASAGLAPPEPAFLPETHRVTRPLSSLHVLERPLPAAVGCAARNSLS